jgi:hypothetical protein
VGPQENYGRPAGSADRQVRVKIVIQRNACPIPAICKLQDFGVFCKIQANIAHVNSFPALSPQ